VTLLTLGIPASLYYFVPRVPAASQQYLVQSATLLAAAGTLGGAALLLAGPLIERLFHAPLIAYVPWLAALTALAVPVSLLPVGAMVDRRSRLAAVFLAGFDVARALALIGVAWWTRSLTAILAAATVALAAQAAVLAGYLVWRGRGDGWRLDGRRLAEQLRYALPFAAAASVGLARDRLHGYFVAGTVPAAEYAAYAVGLLHVPLLDYLTQTVGEVVVLANASSFNAGRTDEMRRVWWRAAYALALVLIPVFFLAQAYAADLIGVLFGAGYAGAVPVLRIYTATVPLGILLASPLLRATGDLRVMLRADLLSLAVAVAALALLVGPLGPVGAVTSLVLGTATFAAWASRRNAQRLGLGWRDFLPWGGLARIAVLAAAAALGPWLMLHDATPALRLLLGGGTAALLYGVVAWRSGLVPAADRQLVRALVARLRGDPGA
ncbi:MAG TPA: oligosaccharide flippase family protein, partial [Methylomirabilota bacterium]|nr:oligosaccharide flippase family protein [Methylomirabilota bacterium]